MAAPIPIERLLAGAGYDTPAAQQAARTVLEATRLTRPGKHAIAAEKRETALAVLSGALAPSCGAAACSALSSGTGRTPVTVSPSACPVCNGSNNQRAALALAERMRARGLAKLLVVGGTPEQHRQLERLLAPLGVSLRCVDGATGSHAQRDADPNLHWAQIVVIWGATPLPHKVSALYAAPPPGVRLVKFARRGIEALCREVLRSIG